MPAFYASGSAPQNRAYREKLEKATPNRLFSLHGSYRKGASRWLTEIHEWRDTSDMGVMFDSGAFTAWSQGEEQPKVQDLLRIYCSALRYCEHKFKHVWFISLDVIPGTKKSGSVTAEQVRDAIKQSDENHHILSAELGERVLPVFHQTEPLSRLDEVVALNPTYICLSPRQGEGFVDKERRTWAMRVHSYLNGKVRTHGLASTGGRMMTEIPWHSVDSATWLLMASYGVIVFLDGHNIKPFFVSEHSGMKRMWKRHVDTATDAVLKVVKWKCEQMGLSIKELREVHEARCIYNMTILAELAAVDTKPAPIPLTLFAP